MTDVTQEAQINAARSAYNTACDKLDRWFNYVTVAIYTGIGIFWVAVILMSVLNRPWIGVTGLSALVVIWGTPMIRVLLLRRRVPPLHDHLRKLMDLPSLR
jgi:hypothetical protein